MVYACAQEVSSRDAVRSLRKLAGLEIERRQLERWTHRIGELRTDERDEAVGVGPVAVAVERQGRANRPGRHQRTMPPSRPAAETPGS